MPMLWRAAGVLVLVLIGAASAWQFQNWRYGKQLADQARLQTETLNQLTMAAAAAQQAEQDRRLVLEQRLSASEQSHYKELSDAQKNQDRMRDRLATSDLRLSVLLDASSTGGCSVPAASGTGGVVHGPIQAELDPAHAQRIVAITDEGDKGLIALQACQAYVRALQPSRYE
ncbi:lysis protein [Pseudomonas sp. NPDC087803]|uniref:lysis protein n=1 Tax=Pseudomonas sp. NPDC087803 TaxID=3364448 RepID=UPI00381EE662